MMFRFNRKHVLTSLITGVLAWMLVLGNLPASANAGTHTEGPADGNATYTLSPAADSYVYNQSPDTHYNKSTLFVRNHPKHVNESLLKFDVSEYGYIARATLRLYGSAPEGIEVFGVDDDSWAEDEVTWNNKPTVSTAALDRTTGAASSGQVYELDVTAYASIQADGVISLLLGGTDSKEKAVFHSREQNAHQPELVIETLSVGFSGIEPSPDSKLVYVSSSTGDDAHDGTIDSPVRTIPQAMTLVRDGYPDWILLKRGDTWQDEEVYRFINGRSAAEPAVVTYYGDTGPRPLIKASKNFVDTNGRIRNYQAYIGLHIVSYMMDPDDPQFDGVKDTSLRFVGGGDYLLIEDCKLQYVNDYIREGFNR